MGQVNFGKLLLLLFVSLIQNGPSSSDWFSLKFLQKASEIAHQLISTLSVQYNIPSKLLVAVMRDCVSSNNIAMWHSRSSILLCSYIRPCTHWVRLLAIALKHGLCGKSKQVNPYVGIPLHNGGAVHGRQWISGWSYLETWSLSLKALDACVIVYQLENKLLACSMFAGYNPLYQLTLQWLSPCLLYQWGVWRGHSKHPACPKTQHCWLNRMIRISRFTSTIGCANMRTECNF